MIEAVFLVGEPSPQVKRCRGCQQTLPALHFYKDRTQPDGLQKYCIPCRREMKGIAQREREAAEARRIREEEKQAVRKEKERRKMAWEQIRAPKDEAWKARKKHREVIKNRERIKAYAKANPEKRAEINKRYRERNIDKVKARQKAWAPKRCKKQRAESAKRHREENKNNPIFILKKRIRTTTRCAFIRKKWKKRNHTHEMLGCSWPILKAHIEKQFSKGMNWKNNGQWHIDHIIPLSSARDEEELKALAHYTNLQPLWGTDNMSKGDKLVTCQPELLLTIG